MEQYLLQLPKRLAQEVRTGISSGESANVDMVSGGKWCCCRGEEGEGYDDEGTIESGLTCFFLWC